MHNSSISQPSAKMDFATEVRTHLQSMFRSNIAQNTAHAYIDVMEKALEEAGFCLGGRTELVKLNNGAPKLIFVDSIVEVGVWAGPRDKIEPDFQLQMGLSTVLRLTAPLISRGQEVTVSTALSANLKKVAPELIKNHYLLVFDHELTAQTLTLTSADVLRAALARDILELARAPNEQLENYKLRVRELVEELAP